MKRYTLRTVDANNETIKESTLQLNENSILIVQMPEKTRFEHAQAWHDYLTKSIKDEVSVITLLDGIQLKMLDIK